MHVDILYFDDGWLVGNYCNTI